MIRSLKEDQVSSKYHYHRHYTSPPWRSLYAIHRGFTIVDFLNHIDVTALLERRLQKTVCIFIFQTIFGWMDPIVCHNDVEIANNGIFLVMTIRND